MLLTIAHLIPQQIEKPRHSSKLQELRDSITYLSHHQTVDSIQDFVERKVTLAQAHLIVVETICRKTR